jgi:hypothetical protein
VVVNGLIYIRQDIPLLKSIYKSVCEVVEKTRSKRMAGRTEHQSISMELNGLLKVRQNTPIIESVSKATTEVVEGHRSIKMADGTEC